MLGRFIGRDPIGPIAGPNLYAGSFVPNQLDPFGWITIEDIKRAIEEARKHPDMAKAADLLEHWLTGAGKTYDIDRDWLRKAFQTEAGERKIEGYFLDKTGSKGGLLKKSADLCASDKTFDDFDDYWDTLLTFTKKEYQYALGSGTLRGTGSFTFSKVPAEFNESPDCCCVLVTGRLKYEYLDNYNWDRDKSTWFPGFGRVRDNDMKALEKGGANDPKSFAMHSEWWKIFTGKVCKGKWVQSKFDYIGGGAPD